MTNHAASFLRLRWVLALLLSLLWVTMGSAAASAEHRHFGHCGFAAKTTKQGGRITEPDLPPKTVVSEDGVDIVHYTRSGDHGPPHLHVKGGGAETKIGQAGKPIDGSGELSAAQRAVVEANKSEIRKAADQIGRWFRFNSSN